MTAVGFIIDAHRAPLQFNLRSRRRHDHFRIRQIGNESRAHPFHRQRITVNEHDLFRSDSFREPDERFARRVRAELKLLDVTAHSLRRAFRIDRYFFIGQGVPQNTSRRFRIGITYEENRMARLIDHSLRENV